MVTVHLMVQMFDFEGMSKRLGRELFILLAKELLLLGLQQLCTKIQSQGSGPLKEEPLF